jgi:hypothetical protein
MITRVDNTIWDDLKDMLKTSFITLGANLLSKYSSLGEVIKTLASNILNTEIGSSDIINKISNIIYDSKIIEIHPEYKLVKRLGYNTNNQGLSNIELSLEDYLNLIKDKKPNDNNDKDGKSSENATHKYKFKDDKPIQDKSPEQTPKQSDNPVECIEDWSLNIDMIKHRKNGSPNFTIKNMEWTALQLSLLREYVNTLGNNYDKTHDLLKYINNYNLIVDGKRIIKNREVIIHSNQIVSTSYKFEKNKENIFKSDSEKSADEQSGMISVQSEEHRSQSVASDEDDSKIIPIKEPPLLHKILVKFIKSGGIQGFTRKSVLSPITPPFTPLESSVNEIANTIKTREGKLKLKSVFPKLYGFSIDKSILVNEDIETFKIQNCGTKLFTLLLGIRIGTHVIKDVYIDESTLVDTSRPEFGSKLGIYAQTTFCYDGVPKLLSYKVKILTKKVMLQIVKDYSLNVIWFYCIMPGVVNIIKNNTSDLFITIAIGNVKGKGYCSMFDFNVDLYNTKLINLIPVDNIELIYDMVGLNCKTYNMNKQDWALYYLMSLCIAYLVICELKLYKEEDSEYYNYEIHNDINEDDSNLIDDYLSTLTLYRQIVVTEQMSAITSYSDPYIRRFNSTLHKLTEVENVYALLDTLPRFDQEIITAVLDRPHLILKELNEHEEFYIMIPYLSVENHIVDNFLDVYENVSIENEDINSCGYQAVKHVTGLNIPIEEFKSTVGNIYNMSTDEIYDVAEIYKLNIIMVHKDYTEIIKKNESDKYYTIELCNNVDIYGNIIPDSGHYYPVKAVANNYPYALVNFLGINVNKTNKDIHKVGINTDALDLQQYLLTQLIYDIAMVHEDNLWPNITNVGDDNEDHDKDEKGDEDVDKPTDTQGLIQPKKNLTSKDKAPYDINLVGSIGVYTTTCNRCKLPTWEHVDDMNLKSKLLLEAFDKVVTPRYDWFLTKGTLIAALRLGKLITEKQDFKKTGLFNYVDTDLDAIILTYNKTKLQQQLLDIMAQIKAIVPFPIKDCWRAKDYSICVMNTTIISFENNECCDCWSIMKEANMNMNWASLDVAIIVCDSDYLLIGNDVKIQDHLGIYKEELPISEILPTVRDIKLYNKFYPRSNNVYVGLDAYMKHGFESLVNLSKPLTYNPIGCVFYCNHINVDVGKLNNALYEIAPKDALNFIKLITTYERKGRSNCLIVFSGSRGDFEPMAVISRYLSKFMDVTNLMPRSMKLQTGGSNVYYIKDLDFMVHSHGNVLKLNLLKYSEMLSNMKNSIQESFDYVIHTTFDKASLMFKPRKKYVSVRPYIAFNDEDEHTKDIVRQLLKYVITKGKDIMTTTITCTPINFESTCTDVVGWPLDEVKLQMDANTENIISWIGGKDELMTVVTFGSMKVKNIQNIIEKVISENNNPILIVVSDANKNTTINFNDNLVDLSINAEHDMLKIVNNCNFILIRNFVKKVVCHGGIGTIASFANGFIEFEIIPIAYDQHWNKDWLVKQGNVTTDLIKEYNTFRNNLHNIFEISEEPEYIKGIELPKFLKLHSILENVNLLDCNYTSKYKLCNVEITKEQTIKTEKHCVLYAGLQCANEMETKNVNDSYYDFLLFNNFSTFVDVINWIVMYNLNLSVTYNDLALLCNLEGFDPINSIILTADCSHANYGLVICKKIIKKDITKTDLSDLRLEAHIEKLNVLSSCLTSFNRLNVTGNLETSKSSILSDITPTLVHQSTLSLTNLNKTSMRKTVQVNDLTRSTITVGIIITNNIQPNYIYKVLTNVGVILGVAISGSGKLVYLIHGIKEVNIAIISWRLFKLATLPEYRYSTKVLKSKYTAINQSTKQFCEEMGMMCTSVGSINADVCYVYNTWNRKHHFEIELDVLSTARMIQIVPINLDSDLINSLFTAKNPRTVILKGEIYTCYNHKFDDTLKSISRNLKECKVIIERDTILIKGYDKKLIELMNSIVHWENSKEHHSLSVCRYFNPSQVSIDEGTYTWKDMTDKFAVLSNEWNLRVLKNYCSEHYQELNNLEFNTTYNYRVNESILERTKVEELFIIDDKLYFSENCYVFDIIIKAKGILTESTIYYGTEKKYGKDSDWFDTSVKQKTKLDKKNFFNITSLGIESDAMNYFNLSEMSYDGSVMELYENSNGTYDIDLLKTDEIKDSITMDYWDDFGNIEDPTLIVPTNKKFLVSSRYMPSFIKEFRNVRLERYPTIARPALTHLLHAELNAVTVRYGDYTSYVKVITKPEDEFNLFKLNYYRKDYNTIITKYKMDKLVINVEASVNWAREHNYPDKVVEVLRNLLEVGYEREPINKFKVVAKVESLVKLSAGPRPKNEVHCRNIMFASYAISAIFSPIFKEVKVRFKDILDKRICYVDGMTPIQINKLWDCYDGIKYLVGDDLTKQDRQTTHLIIEIERLIYKDLGVDENILQLYLYCHKNWKWAGKGINGVWDAMRLTGQVTTSIGNSITNMVVHNRLMNKNKDNIELYCVLGDDAIFLCKKKIDIGYHGTITKEVYNMVSKIEISGNTMPFLSMLAYIKDGKTKLCPWFKRLRHRFSVSNYNHSGEEMVMKLNSRVVSYCHMLGKIKGSMEIAQKLASNTEIADWYNVPEAIEVNAGHENSNVEAIENLIGMLIHMMKENEPIVSNYKAFSKTY